jgi:hypothetical protein
MSDSQDSEFSKPPEDGWKASDEGMKAEGLKPPAAEPHPRAVGSPLPIGSGGASSQPASPGESLRPFVPPPPPGRALTNAPSNASPVSIYEVPTGVQKALSAVRSALPWVQRILPLLDGNIGMAVSNMLAPHHPSGPAHPPAQSVDLAPIKDGLVELQTQQHEIQTQQRDLRGQLVEQNASLKRVEDHLEMVREATDRNTLEQQELMEDLKAVGNKVNLFAIIAMGLLAISVLINVVLYLHILRVLP